MAEDVPAAHTDEDEEDVEPLSAKMARLRKEAAGKKAMGTSSGVRSGGRPLLEDLSEGLLTFPLNLALILGLTALSLRLKRMPLTPVMKSNFPRSSSNFLSSFLSLFKLLTKGEKYED
jgi:hypothetical protein